MEEKDKIRSHQISTGIEHLIREEIEKDLKVKEGNGKKIINFSTGEIEDEESRTV